jgi:hypothetical protein
MLQGDDGVSMASVLSGRTSQKALSAAKRARIMPGEEAERKKERR